MTADEREIDKRDCEFACFILENLAGHALACYEKAVAKDAEGTAYSGEVAFAARAFNVSLQKLLAMQEMAASLPDPPTIAEILQAGFDGIRDYEEDEECQSKS